MSVDGTVMCVLLVATITGKSLLVVRIMVIGSGTLLFSLRCKRVVYDAFEIIQRSLEKRSPKSEARQKQRRDGINN